MARKKEAGRSVAPTVEAGGGPTLSVLDEGRRRVFAVRVEQPGPGAQALAAVGGDEADAVPLTATVAHAHRPRQKFEPLPRPTGAYPFHLRLDDVLSDAEIARIRNAGKLVFHTCGDSGGVKAPAAQIIVAMHMVDDFAGPAPDRPAFFYHLGDVVYFNGEQKEYYPQFYEPYADYAAPIFAIPGNHDGDPIDDSEPSLSAFVRNFCSAAPVNLPEAGEHPRDAMTQPNVYWTMEAPFTRIIGMYTNVPEGGQVGDNQIAWLRAELESAPADRALVLALHHPIYSVDTHHSGSARMKEVVEEAVERAGRAPDIVLTGHVHNYQRFSAPLGGKHIPFIVAGAGGYHNLHYVPNNLPKPPVKVRGLPGVTLHSWCDDRHGFLRLEVHAGTRSIVGRYTSVPRPHESWRHGPTQVVDRFTHQLSRPINV